MKNLDPKTLDRIKKLLATANGTNFEGEAQTAMRMAQDMMARHGVSMDDVNLANALKEEIVKEELGPEDNFRSNNPERWAMVLAMAVATVFDCRAFQTMYWKRSTVTFAGYADDVKMAKLVFTCLYVAIRAAACKALPNPSDHGKPRLSFRLGVANRLYHRALLEKEESKKEPTGRFELVVRTKEQNVTKWLEERTKFKSSRPSTAIDPLAYHMGQDYGDKMDLMSREKVNQQPQGLLAHR